MNEALQSLWAIFAGLLVVIGLTKFTDIMLERQGIIPPVGPYSSSTLALALLYRIIFAIVGGYITAYLAPHDPIEHAAVLGLFGTLSGIMNTVVNWDPQNIWYPILVIVTALPSVWLGAKLRTSGF